MPETSLEPTKRYLDPQNTNGPVHDLSLIMENLSIQDPSMHGPPGPGGIPPSLGRPPPPQQLPAQMFTTAAQLLDLTDSKHHHMHAHEPRAELTPHREAHGGIARRAQVDGHSAELGSVWYASCEEGRSLRVSS